MKTVCCHISRTDTTRRYQGMAGRRLEHAANARNLMAFWTQQVGAAAKAETLVGK
jgi:hypothetical protein